MPQIIRRQTVGLALGGGGARGLAHIGVLKTLEAARIPVDFLAGTSIGGIIAAAYSAGLSVAELEIMALQMAKPSQMMRLLDVAPMRRGLLEGQRVREFLADKLGDITFDKLHIPLALVTVDFLRGVECQLTHGSVLEAAMATSAVPGVFPPVEIEGCMMVDGGLINNVPANAVKALGAEVVIAVDVAPIFPREISPDAAQTLHQLPAPFPKLTGNLYQALLIMTAHTVRANLHEARPDLVIQPAMPDEISILLGFTHASEAIAAGEQAAQRALPKIQQLLQPSLQRTVQRIFSGGR